MSAAAPVHHAYPHGWNDAINAAIKACLDERVDAKATKHEADYAYNNAIADCVRALKGLKMTAARLPQSQRTEEK